MCVKHHQWTNMIKSRPPAPETWMDSPGWTGHAVLEVPTNGSQLSPASVRSARGGECTVCARRKLCTEEAVRGFASLGQTTELRWFGRGALNKTDSTLSSSTTETSQEKTWDTQDTIRDQGHITTKNTAASRLFPVDTSPGGEDGGHTGYNQRPGTHYY